MRLGVKIQARNPKEGAGICGVVRRGPMATVPVPMVESEKEKENLVWELASLSFW